MTLPRRAILAIPALLAMRPAHAAAYPERPIRLIVPYAPGGNSDTTARVIAPRMAERLGQPVIVENRAGAGGSVAALQVAHMRSDGYVMILGSNGPLTVNPSLQRNLGYDPLTDFAPIGLAVRTPQTLVVHMLRTRKIPFFQSTAAWPVLMMTCIVLMAQLLNRLMVVNNGFLMVNHIGLMALLMKVSMVIKSGGLMVKNILRLSF